jgi:hypothetical protein
MNQLFRTSEPGVGRLVARKEYVQYLRRCADEWESLPVYGSEAHKDERYAAHKRQAERIRARAAELSQ